MPSIFPICSTCSSDTCPPASIILYAISSRYVFLRCPLCAGRMIATIDDPAVIQRILADLGLPGAREDPRPPLLPIAAEAEQPTLPSVTV